MGSLTSDHCSEDIKNYHGKSQTNLYFFEVPAAPSKDSPENLSLESYRSSFALSDSLLAFGFS